MTASARPPAPSENITTAALYKLTAALEVFRSHPEDPPFTLQQVFLAIARRKIISASQICAEVRISQSAVSRNIIILGRGRAGELGLGLVVQEIDPIEARAHAIKLTAKGQGSSQAACGMPRRGSNEPS